MKYVCEPFWGKNQHVPMTPYMKTVNNGYAIKTQNADLIKQLQENEINREPDVIDWHLFKVGETVLIDNNGNKFGCAEMVPGGHVTLNLLLE